VVRALDAIALTDDEVTAAIATALESDESIDVQLAAIQALRKIDEPSATVIYALVEAFSSFDRDSQVSSEANKALEEISLENMNREAVRLLIANFRSSNYSALYYIEYCSLPKEILSRNLPVMSQLSESEQSQVQEILTTECWTIAASSVPEFVASLRRRWPW
jgi:HEAT repeat protein